MEESSTQEVRHHCVVPDWNLPTRHQGQSLTHVQFQPGLSTTTPPFHYPLQMHIAAEIGAMHGADTNAINLLPPMLMAPPVKPRWGSCDTLESIVRQATRRDFGPPKPEDDPQTCLRSCTENHRKATRIPGPIPPSQVAMRKRSCTSEPVLWRKNACLSSRMCASSSSTFDMREDGSNTMTTTKLTEEDDTSQDESGSKDEEGEVRGGTGHTSRYSKQSKTVATTTHNLSEPRRRDRINEKMKNLQKMVPNSSKTDKASMLDEVIGYMKQLQAQVEMMKIMRSSTATTADDNVNVPQMMNVMMTMPRPATLPPQQQLQMSFLTRMGVGLGLGMLGHANGTSARNAFVAPTVPQPHLPPHFLMPQMIPATTFNAGHLNPNVSGPLASMPMHDPYAALLAQKISMDNYYNKLAVLHHQRIRDPFGQGATSIKHVEPCIFLSKK